MNNVIQNINILFYKNLFQVMYLPGHLSIPLHQPSSYLKNKNQCASYFLFIRFNLATEQKKYIYTANLKNEGGGMQRRREKTNLLVFCIQPQDYKPASRFPQTSLHSEKQRKAQRITRKIRKWNAKRRREIQDAKLFACAGGETAWLMFLITQKGSNLLIQNSLLFYSRET